MQYGNITVYEQCAVYIYIFIYIYTIYISDVEIYLSNTLSQMKLFCLYQYNVPRSDKNVPLKTDLQRES